MNKHCFRVVFNKARGMMMVVSETTKSQSKTAGSDRAKKSRGATAGSPLRQPLSYSRLAMAILCCQSMVYTQVQAATTQIQNTAANIPIDQRAALLKAPNGTPIVNIRTPNSNGLSHNTYNQFDIGSNGAVLNNSIGSSSSQLAGVIAGNQYLAQSAASTILNEVRSNAPVQFQGNLEVAGQRADVIIASPSGLQVQGGGFINANRATLTTGTPKIDSTGNLTGFDVKQGHIQFDNAITGNALGGDLYSGSNKNQANYVDVLARAVTINGQIHANQDVNIVSGSNSVNYDTGNATKIVGSGIRPTLAVDVSTLGGIYANSINLIGTENGLGVRNAGNIKATQQVILTNSGKIENTGTIATTKAQTSLVSLSATGSTGNIEHSGTISSYGLIDLQADKDILLNKGIVKKNSAGTATQLMPDIIRMDATGALKVSNLSDVRNLSTDKQANVYLNSGQDAYIDSQSIVSSNGGIAIDADRTAYLMGGSKTLAGDAQLTVYAKNGTVIDNASVTSRGDLRIGAGKDDSTLTADTIIRNNSQLQAQKSLTISAERDTNITTGSRITSANTLALQAGRNAVIDGSGSITATGEATIKANELVDIKNNTLPISIGKQLTIEGKQASILNSSLKANDGITVNTQGRALTITNSTLSSEKGAVAAVANQAALNVNNLTTNANSTVLAATGNVGITGSTLNTDNIVVESGNDTSIYGLTTTAKNLQQIGGMSVSAKANTSISNSQLSSTGNVTVNSNLGISLTDNKIQAQGIALKTVTAKTAKNDKGIDNTYGDGDITVVNTELSATGNAANGVVIDAANHLNMINTKTLSTGSSTLKSGNLMRLNNSQINSGKHLTINSNNQLITNGERYARNSGTVEAPKWSNSWQHIAGDTTLQANEILSIDSRLGQTYQNTNISGGAVIINSANSLTFNSNTNIDAKGNAQLAKNSAKLSDGSAASTLNGDLVISSATGNLTIDPKNVVLNALGDATLVARGGKLHLKGYAGTQGLGSEQVVKLTAGGDINLSGKEVLIEGSDLLSVKKDANNKPLLVAGKPVPTGGINIAATVGSVELKGVKNSFSNYVSPYKINTINSTINEAKVALSQPFYDTKWLEDYNKEVLEWERHVMSSCVDPIPYGSYSRCVSLRSKDMKYAARNRPKYVEMSTSANYEAYMSYLSRQETLRGTLSGLTQILATSQKTSIGFEHKAASVTAGRDINITAKQGVLIEGADISSSNGGISILAEGNLPPTATKDVNNMTVGINHDSIRITGLADIYQQGDISKGNVTGPNYSYHQLIKQPTLTAKNDIKILAQGGRDTNTVSGGFTNNNAVILNSADVRSSTGDVYIDAARGDINLEASQAAFMDGSQTTSTSRKWYGKKKVTTTTKTANNSNAVTTDIAAKNIKLTSDGDINIYGSALTAAPIGRIEVTAGRALNLYAIENLDESSSDIKKKSSFLGIRYNKNHTNDTRQELTQLPTTLIGGKAYTKSGGSTLLQGTVFDTLNPDDIQVGVGKYADAKAQIILDTITTRITTTHNQEKESTVWQKTVDKGDVVTTGTLPKFNQTPTMTTPNGVVIVVPVDVTVSGNNQAKLDIQKSPEELGKIALNLSKQPGYEYLAALDKTNNINWAQVDLIQKNWNYTQEGLTPGAAALIAIAIAVAAGPAGTGLSASMVATNAAGIALQTQAVITLINNKGDISKTLKDLASSDTIRNMATAALTAGLTAKFGLSPSPDYNFSTNLAKGIGKGISDAVVNSAINGVSFEEALKNSLRGALVDSLAAEAFGGVIKDIDGEDFASNFAHKLVAGGLGCITSSAKNQSCAAGTLGSIIGESIADYYITEEMQTLINADLMPITYITELNNKIKLVTGTVALIAGVDVDSSVNSAIFAAENNGYNKSAEAVVLDESVLSVYAAITGIILKPVIIADFYGKYNSATTDAQREKLLVEVGLSLVVSKTLASKFLKFRECFVAGTLIETIDGLKAIETIKQGDLIWSRHEETLEYGYRPVVDTVSYNDKDIYEVVVKDNHGKLETYQTTEEHPFWVVNTGFLPASLLQTGMTLVNRDDHAVLTVISQAKLDKTDTVYNFEVAEFHTYHVGEFGVWVHNACITVSSLVKNDTLLLREARKLSQQESQGINQMLEQVLKGNNNPGIGTKVFNGITEFRHASGGRLYARKIGSSWEVLGYSGKGNQPTVINRIVTLYGK